MADHPKQQLKRLALGTLISLVAMGVLVFTVDSENQIYFYALSVIIVAGVLYAIPGYIGVWVWRMRAVIFRNRIPDSDSDSQNNS